MKRKELSARLLAGALSFSMAAGLCAPSLTAFAAEENQVAAEEAVADEADIPAEEQDGAVSENVEESIAAEENAADASDSENESDAEETEVSAEDTENTDAEGSEEEEAGSEEVQEASEEATPDVTDETEASTYEAEPSEEAEDPAADEQEEEIPAEEVPEESAEEPVELIEVLTEEPAEAAALEEGDAEEEIQYVMMNIPYADFYEAEVDNEVPVDAFSSATLNKTRTSSLVGGSYHVNSDGSDITGITYPVKLGEGVDLSAYKKLTDSDSVTISVTNRGQTSTTTYTGVDALFESDSYSYYVLSEEPSYYKELTVNEDGSLSFGKAQGTETTLANVAAEFMTESSYGDYQLNVDGLTLESDTKVYGVVVQTDKNSYGLRHMENIWRQTNLSWATGFTTNVHGCPTSSEHYKAMMGQTITGLVYYTSEGIYNITLDESVYVPVKFEYALEVENASVSAGTAKVTVSGLPADFDAQYSVEGLEGVKVSDGALTYTASSAKNGKYTLTVTDAGNVYAPISVDFELYADEMPAAYDEAQKAIVAASGATAEDLAAYLANITSVSVNGKSYAASGRGSVEIISADGTVKTDAAPIAEDGTYELVVSATGYQPLTFTYSKGETAEIQYVMMNIPYADFYKAEVDNEVPVDAFSSATLNKTRTSSLVGGSYHVNSDGSDITGITYPVKLGEGVDLSAYKKLTDSDSVTISVTNRGQTSTTTYTGVDALFESDSYSYYVLSEEPSYYKELTVNEDGSLSFGKVQGTETTLANVAAEFMTESSYGDYQLNVDGLTLGSDTKVYGVVVQTDKNSYGLRHMENIWRQTNLSWATGFTTNVHGCPTSSEHYKAMMGQTITGLVYYTSEGIYNITLDESVYVPVKFEYALEVENASVSAGTAKVTVSGLPADFDAQYSVEGLEGVEVSDGALTHTASSAKNGKYTLTVTDAGNVYAPISADFELYADEMPAAYDETKKAIVAASGATAEDLAAYLANITSVSVNGKSYAASGRGAVVIINADGTVKTDAAPIAEDGTYAIVVSSTGYRPLEFTYSTAAPVVQINTSGLEAAIKAAEALKSADYTAESWAKVQTALTVAKKTLAAPGTQAAADASAKQLTAAVQALVKAEQPQKPAEPEKPAVGTVSTYNNVQYKVTGTNTVVAAATGNKSVTSVKIPATVTINGQKFNVTSVSSKAFYGCKKLKTVEISKNVTTIGSSAFENCTALTKVTGCSGVTTVGSKAFSGCSKLTTVKGFTKVTSIGTKAFYNCKKLTAIGSKSSTITLAKVKTIGNNAFQNCKAVKKVNLTSTALTKIGVSAFQGCTAMTSFTSKSTKLASIGKNAFYGDSKLATVSLKTSKLTKAKVGSNAFKKIKSTCTFKVPSKKVSSYKTILKARGAGSKIKVKKL